MTSLLDPDPMMAELLEALNQPPEVLQAMVAEPMVPLAPAAPTQFSNLLGSANVHSRKRMMGKKIVSSPRKRSRPSSARGPAAAPAPTTTIRSTTNSSQVNISGSNGFIIPPCTSTSFEYIRETYESLIEPISLSPYTIPHSLSPYRIRAHIAKLHFINNAYKDWHTRIQSNQNLSVDDLYNITLSALKSSGLATM